MTGDKDNGNPNARLSQLALKIQTAESGEPHVQNKATWPIRPLAAYELLRRREGLGTQANRLQHPTDGSAHQIVVIDYVHGRGRCRRHSSASAWLGRLRSRLTPRPHRSTTRSLRSAMAVSPFFHGTGFT